MPSLAQILLDKFNGISHDDIEVRASSIPPAEPLPPVALLEAKSKITEALRNGVWTVKFRKVNGEETEMDCTLDSSFIPQDPDFVVGAITKNKPQKENLVHAYSTDRQGWRSFRVENLIWLAPKV